MAQIDQVVVDGSPMAVYLALPDSAARRPAVIYMHHRYGIETFARTVCDRLAQAGFVAAAPDLFHRRPDDEPVDARRSHMRDDEAIADIGATLDHVAAIAATRPREVAILGHCMGGRMALVGASAVADIGAAVTLYGGNMFVPFGEGGPSAFDRLKSIRCPVAGFFGNEDRNPSPADVDRMAAELARARVPHVFHRYDGAGHGFAHFTIESLYRPAAAADAWAKSLAFLNEVFAAAA